MRGKLSILIGKSEKLLKTDIRYVMRGGFWLTFGQIATTAGSFLLSVVFANLLPAETYGMYRYLLALAGIMGILSLSGLNTAVTRAAARGEDGALVSSFKINLVWNVFVSAASCAGAAYYYFNGNHTLAIGLLIIAVFSPLLDSAELFNSFLVGKKDFYLSSALRSWRSAVALVGLTLTILITKNVLLILLSYFIIHTAFTLFAFWYTLKKHRPNDVVASLDLLHLGKHLSIMGAFASFADKIDNVLVFHYLGPIQLAVYNFALIIPNQMSGLVKNLGILATPHFVLRDKAAVQKTLAAKSFKIFILTLPAVVIYILIAPYLFKVFFPQYIEAVLYSQVYAIVALVTGTLPAAFLDSHIAIKEKYVVNILSNTIKIVLLFVGAYWYGIWGLVIGRLISKAIGVGLSFIAAQRI